MRLLAIVLVSVFVIAAVAGAWIGLGMALAWVLAQFGVSHPWYVYSVALTVCGWVLSFLSGAWSGRK